MAPLAEWPIDWTTSALLAAVVAAEGIRRAPRGSTVIGMSGLVDCKLVRHVARDGLSLISWGSPFAPQVLLPPTGRRTGPPGLARRWRRIRRWLPLLRLLSGSAWLVLVLGVPLAIGRWGPLGLAAGVAVCLELAVLLVIVSGLTLEHAGVPPSRFRPSLLALLSPFAAPHAAEAVVELAFRDAPPLATLQQLMRGEEFEALIRPRAYDVLQRGADDLDICELVSRTSLERIVHGVPGPASTSSTPYCPRCGQTYQQAVRVCTDCDGLPLVVS